MSSVIVPSSPNDLAFQPLVGRPAQAPASYQSRAWGWVTGVPSALIGKIWARKEDPITGASSKGASPFAIVSKDLKAYIFQFLDLRDLAAAQSWPQSNYKTPCIFVS